MTSRQDVLPTASQPRPHAAFRPPGQSRSPDGGAQLPGVAAEPPARLPPGQPVSAAGPAGSHHPPAADDRVTPPADDR